jgi:hypothetical protein
VRRGRDVAAGGFGHHPDGFDDDVELAGQLVQFAWFKGDAGQPGHARDLVA